MSTQKLVIDPVTRIEGHLRIEVQIEGGRVADAWSSGMMFRGIERVFEGRDPREAWLVAQRICGVCTTVHALASVRAVEAALGIGIPHNARILRNLMAGTQYLHDHVVHFYQLHAFDWADLSAALAARPVDASDLARSMSLRPDSSPEHFAQVQERFRRLFEAGQAGIFGSAYWGHPAYQLPPAAGLVILSHYLEALDWQSDIARFHAILGGKNPHPQTYLVGGMAIPVDPRQASAINPQRIAELRALAARAYDFVADVFIPDLLMLGSYYKQWATIGAGVGNYLSFGDFPVAGLSDPTAQWLPPGLILDRILGGVLPYTSEMVSEYVTRSWYDYSVGDALPLQPLSGETRAHYTGPQPPFAKLATDGKYSWLKAPRYAGLAVEVGPLARMLIAYGSRHVRARECLDKVTARLEIGLEGMFSTLGRMLARGVETLMVAEQLPLWISELEGNMQRGELAVHNGYRWEPATWPPDAAGWGSVEAPRGALGHWVRIAGGKIQHYQTVVPTTWNGSPRDAQGQRGPWETALIGTPVIDPARPVEILRTLHSFDPCMACAVH